MAVVIGELGVLEFGVQLTDVRQEFRIAPFTPNRRLFGVALVDGADFRGTWVSLFLRPHEGRVGFVIPHGVAEKRVHEDVRLVHVADHALARRDGAGELVLEGMARFPFRDGRIDGLRLAAVTELGVTGRVARIAVVGVNHVAGGAAGAAVVPGVVVGAQEPHDWVVQPRLVNVEDRYGDAQPGTRPTVRLTYIGPARLFQALQLPNRVGQADLGKQVENIAPAALEHPEDVPRWRHLPGGKREKLGQDPALRHPRVRLDRGFDACRHALAGIGLAEDIVLERQDAVVIGRPAPEHRAGRHDAGLRRIDDGLVAGAAGLIDHPVVAGIDEADEFRAFLVEKRIGSRGIGAAGIMPGLGVTRLDMRPIQGRAVREVSGRRTTRQGNRRLAAMTVGATQHHAGAGVHRRLIGTDVAGKAAQTLPLGLGLGLPGRRRRRFCVDDVAGLFPLARGGDETRHGNRRSEQHTDDSCCPTHGRHQ